MRAAFQVKSTFLAEVGMDLDKTRIITEVVAQAEKLDLGTGDYAIFDIHNPDLKAVVRFASRIIHVMTPDEAEKAGLPKPPRHADGQ
jgi:hypothetical protein